MPIRTGWSGLWDIQVRVKGQGPIKRIASLNHPIKVQLDGDKASSVVSLKNTVDRTLVPCKDFVLLVRDEKMTDPSIIAAQTLSGH